MNYFQSEILFNRLVSEGIYEMQVAGHGEVVLPGQFFMLKCESAALTLMRPISVYRFTDSALSFMYRVVGKGTAGFSCLKKDDTVSLLGPLGNGFPCDAMKGKIALVGGGIGIPPLFETAKKLKQNGLQVDTYLGFKDKDFISDEFEKITPNLFVASETGIVGHHGFVTDLLKPENYDAVFTCGPEVMMRKVATMCKAAGTPSWCSMENRMGCGIGACLVCSCKTSHGMKKVCSDGPVFQGDDLFFS